MGDGRWAMGDGRWAMGDGRWAMGDGRWAMGDGRGTLKIYFLKIQPLSPTGQLFLGMNIVHAGLPSVTISLRMLLKPEFVPTSRNNFET
jgi:hypothetical protein